jgi:hypothetical protein
MSKFWKDALERIGWSTLEGAATGALAGWGLEALADVDGATAFGVAVAVPAGLAFFTAVKTLAARQVGDVTSAAISPSTGRHVAE